nr:DUF4293 domain-containing protein [Saprospiraceae bacterium]
MIQRIQSVFLLLAGAAYASLFTLPVATSEETFGTIMADGIFETYEFIWLLIVAIFSIVLSLVNIFLFKNRKLQKRICLLTTLLGLGWAVLAFYKILTLEEKSGVEISVEHDLAFISVLAAIVFTALAFHFIKKDEKLIRSMNSLR